MHHDTKTHKFHAVLCPRLMHVSGQQHASAALPPLKEPTLPIGNIELVWASRHSEEKNTTTAVNRTQLSDPVGSYFTD
jgi:hypothetical protein